ncbi:MAG: iron-sulfur cluster repair di-iron protein [Bryobacterales bacterium]|nr:iron-sulfur cluster repair di-iron protein [Bryobacterales bacterium]
MAQTVRDAVLHNPAMARVFERHGIDYCCGGQRPLDEVCTEKGLSPEALIAEALPPTEPDIDWNQAPLPDLIQHILDRHHVYLRAALPELERKLVRVREAHGATDGPTLEELGRIFIGLRDELMSHMAKEEQILFPMIQRLSSGLPAPMSLDGPIGMMEYEHESAGNALAAMRRVTSGYVLPAHACGTYSALYHQLAELEADLHQHIHLENNILFPRAAGIRA